MANQRPLLDDEVIDVGAPRQRRWGRWLLGALVLAVIAASRLLGIYLSALWFGSLGYSTVYFYVLKFKAGLFLLFALLTIVILRGVFWLLERAFSSYGFEERTFVLNNQPIQFSPARFVRPIAWLLSSLFGLYYGLAMKSEWQTFALYFNQASTSLSDPIFQRPLGFYLFSLPVYDLISSWLTTLVFVILCAATVYTVLTLPAKALKPAKREAVRNWLLPVSLAVGAFFLMLASRAYLSRYSYLWEDHQTFTGVSFTEANYLLPALVLVATALLVAAAISILNAVINKGFRLLLLAASLPLAVYIVGVILVPAYVTSFIVKPNELGRETPYIEHNIAWTRQAFGLDQVTTREFQAEPSVEGLDLADNRATLENIRLWDWRALQDTLKQLQAIRTYYDFPDVDVDRYKIGGQRRQMMIAAREIDTSKLPESSRNWINEKLIYTHGYGVTMNTANGFTNEGMPQFVISNMPVVTSSEDVKVTRPEIYYGQETNTDVYARTRQNEFDFPQGEANTYTTYQGTGGIEIGGSFRRMLLAWALGDLSKLPFSDDVTTTSRVLIHRNIHEILNGIAPFLVYDADPYIVVSDEGRLYWIVDAFTESAHYPYSRHHTAGDKTVNYIRNSVKAVIDAYNGTTTFYIFDSQDPLISTYRAVFPTLFRDASQMPPDLRSHVRYPETLIRVQGEVFGLYHTQNPKVFFQREDVWSVAQQLAVDDDNKKQLLPIDPYFVLMQLPEEQAANEFVLILPFTPANRNNMIGWMAGRCDGENYGKLLVYNFPKSRLIDGPLQIEARIDQNSQLSSQFTLWNQQGSRVLRGHLLVIPIGRSLLYVEPVYLRAQTSPMPELRIVVLAAQERLGYGQSFDQALLSLAGQSAVAPVERTGAGKEKPSEETQKSVPVSTEALPQLVNRALQEFDEYQRLTSEGKLAEAGQKLEQHKKTLEELKKATPPPR